MPQLAAAVRRLVNLGITRLMMPTDAGVADAFAVAWFECRALLGPEFRGGRLEAIVNEHAATRLAQLLGGFRAAEPVNDQAWADAMAEIG
jgi:hypothetical protein